MLFGNNFTQGRNHGWRKDYFPAEGTLAGKRRKVFARSDGIFDSFGWESIGLYIIDNLDGDPIATRPEESWFTLPDVPQVLA